MNEKALEKKLRTEVTNLGGMCLKFSSPYYTGMPDRIVLLPFGKIIFVELKSPGEVPTERQEAVHQKLRDRWFAVYVIDSEDGLDRLVQHMAWLVHPRRRR